MDIGWSKDLDGFSTVHLNDSMILRERRIRLNLTQQVVANRAKIPVASYQQFESGRRKIRRASFQIACQVLAALEIDFDSFYRGDYSNS